MILTGKEQRYKGLVIFYKSIKYQTIFTTLAESVEEWKEYCSEDDVFLNSCEVDVEFKNTTQDEIDLLEEQVKRERAESMRRIDVIQGRIQELRALTHAA